MKIQKNILILRILEFLALSVILGDLIYCMIFGNFLLDEINFILIVCLYLILIITDEFIIFKKED